MSEMITFQMNRDDALELMGYLLDRAAEAKREALDLVGGQRNRAIIEAADCGRWASLIDKGPTKATTSSA